MASDGTMHGSRQDQTFKYSGHVTLCVELKVEQSLHRARIMSPGVVSFSLLMSKKRVHQGAAAAGEIFRPGGVHPPRQQQNFCRGGVAQGGAAAACGYRGGGIPPPGAVAFKH